MLDSRILITGAQGLVGTSLIEELNRQGYTNLIPLTREHCDLTNYEEVKLFFRNAKPEVVFHTAAAVYGIGGNAKKKGSIFLDNVLLNTHVIEASRLSGAKKIIAMGTIAAYPEPTEFPVKENNIWSGPPHQSENSYGHAKRTMLAQLLAYQENYGLDFAYVISTNLFGPNDKFDSKFGHVVPSLVRKFYEAKKSHEQVTIWGDGSAERDFLYSKDMARALILIMNRYTGPINVASGRRSSIKELVDLLANHFEMQDKVVWDAAMPNGRAFYEIDLTCLKTLGYMPVYSMEKGLLETLDWFTSMYEKNAIRGCSSGKC
ncbi:MAG: NAD-dependent epimerase/dehydratase family protein [Candidatus Rhabdochlamydia sp.]